MPVGQILVSQLYITLKTKFYESSYYHKFNLNIKIIFYISIIESMLD